MSVNVKEVFKEELSMIDDKEIRQFVIRVFEELTPDYFWVEQSSSTGKYHPSWNQGEGGIVRHVKVTTFYGDSLTRAIPLTREEVRQSGLGRTLYSDVVVAACLLHDCEKHGPSFDGSSASMPKNNSGMHGIAFAKKVFEAIFKDSNGDIPFKFRAILRGIAGHMGIWTDKGHRQYFPYNQKDSVMKKVCTVVHLADYISSRKPTESVYEILRYEG
jgi:hypothetical protein